MKSRYSFILFFGVLILVNLGCKKQVNKESISSPEIIHTSMKKLTDVIVHDVFSPPVASRIYAYASIAAYEALVPGYPQYRSLKGQLKDLKDLPQPVAGEEYCFPLASVHAFLKVGRAFTFSGEKIDEFEPGIYKKYKDNGISDEVYERSMKFGDTIAVKILEWAGKDGYKETRGFRYTVESDPGKWKPTPPGYMDAIEPNWYKLRPFALDSCSQFKPKTALKFSIEKDSPFFKEVMEVYEISKNMNAEQRAMASFWDCNPFVMHLTGHVMYATKKISPGGHWINIAAVASRKSKADIMKTVETYALVSVSLADAFISCWDEKYRSAVIRPETVINEHIDKDWQPLLQTPPFPEYPSGHSVASAAASVALTSLYGDTFSYTDSTENEFGLPSRSYKSFHEAAKEAAISRIYGGIHYMSAINNGFEEGENVGKLIVSKIKTRKDVVAFQNTSKK
ncbi:vanadium-dependent haloperoxidase [Rubrolithibacter danxiaensis]|uniref:vanadium-dependent haloperoxidase n=1 Tax=Rubrolithibacter danxiaensis TaxID=3390805 RepID=UPI003BF8CE14